MDNQPILKEKCLTYKEKILKYLELRGGWVYGYELCGKNTPFGWLGSCADRVARDMSKEGLIEREGREDGNFYARFRIKNYEQRN